MRILLFGLPGSGKTTLAKELVKLLPDAIHINADEVRHMYNDWDFSPTGRERQAFRMRSIADSCVETYKIADFVAPTKELRAIYNADFSVWMNTIAEGRFEDTNKAWRIPTENEYDVIIDTFIPPEEEAKRLCHLILEAQQG